MRIARSIVLILSVILVPFAVQADGLTLSISDRLGRAQDYALADMDAYPQIVFETATIWTDGIVQFSGVPLAELLDESGIDGGTLRLTALNAYSIDFPVAEIGEEFPIVATRLNGETMPVRDKGPFWLVYPYDSDPAFQTETIYARSIWQLHSIEVVE